MKAKEKNMSDRMLKLYKQQAFYHYKKIIRITYKNYLKEKLL